MKKESSIYIYNKRDYAKDVIKGMLIASIVGMLFYSSLLGIILLLPFGFVHARKKKIKRIESQKWKLNLEFLDALYSLSAALSSGYAAENIWREALKDLKVMYDDENLIIQEFQYMVERINNNITIEEVLSEFALRTGLENISDFCQVFLTGKATGGNLVKIVQNTSRIINDKVEVKREIMTLIAAKKLESRIMNIIPMGIIIYLRVFSSGFLDSLYHNVFGFLFMTIVLIIYYIAICISDNIMNIEV